MLARNPKTGAQIRIMKSDASLWKNRKTLVWANTVTLPRLNRWDSAYLGIPACDENKTVLLLDTAPETIAWLRTAQARKVRFLVVTQKLVDAVGEEEFHGLSLGNVLCLDELHTMYPYIGHEWDGSAEDALVILAIIFRYSVLIGVESSKRLESLVLDVNLKLVPVSSATAPEPLVLIQQFYKPAQARRFRELQKCLTKNLENPFVDRILLFVEDPNIALPADPQHKLTAIPLKSRLTYWDCINAIQTHVGAGSLVVFANTDIYLDETWKQLWSVDLKDVLGALLRYEDSQDGSEPQIFGPRADSQDTWFIHSDSVVSRTWKPESFQIPFGRAGCDNAILVEFLRQKFKIVNPAMSLRTIHCHQSAIRSYDPHDIVDKPIYMHVEPTGIHELDPLTTWEGWAGPATPHESFDRPLAATNSKMLNTFCSQMNRDPSYVWAAQGYNAYMPPANQDRPIDVSGGAFVSPAGLVYRHTKLCVGNTDIQKTIWSENTLSHLLPAQPTRAMMAFPLEAAWFEQPALYVLNYLSRVLAQHEKTPEASFWCKQSKPLLSAFRLFRWKEPRGHLLHYGDQTQAFAERVVGRTCHGVRLLPGDVDALRRNLFGNWEEAPAGEAAKLVIVADGVHIKDDLLDALEASATTAGFEVKVVWAKAEAELWAGALVGASRVILSTSAKSIPVPTWAWLWLAPKGCEVLELQEDREPSDSLVHLSGAAGLKWTLLQYPRSTPAGFQKFVVDEFGKWLASASAKVSDSANGGIPVVWTPPKSMKFGFFGHKGDSFREMIDLWAEAGFVERREDPSLTQCWLGAPGATLLYDRPTWDWIAKAPPAEQAWKLALVGNPDVAEKPNTKPWTFWPRQPKLVESLVGAGVGAGAWDARPESLVFYGRVENEKQGAHRQDIEGWRAICSKFSMPVGAKEPYALGPEEYLRALAGAKYGLTLRGYGPKCNREIELLAMGCVPIVTAGVDISGYAEPLVDGKHVIVVKSPEDAQKAIASIDETRWREISEAGHAWWKRNASVAGSWAVTRALAGV